MKHLNLNSKPERFNLVSVRSWVKITWWWAYGDREEKFVHWLRSLLTFSMQAIFGVKQSFLLQVLLPKKITWVRFVSYTSRWSCLWSSIFVNYTKRTRLIPWEVSKAWQDSTPDRRSKEVSLREWSLTFLRILIKSSLSKVMHGNRTV